jgi:hypothetical protein
VRPLELMDNYNRKIIFLVLPMVLALCFSACGGNAGSANTAKYLVEGKVVKGAVQNASVKIYTLSAHGYRQTIIGEGTTSSDGSFSAQVEATSGPVALVVASGGDYADEATGQRVTIPSWWEMSAVVSWPSDNTKVVLTPLTQMAAEQALSNIAGGENALTAMENAKLNVANSFGLSGVDISKTEPADLAASPTTAMQRGNAEVEYGLVLAALSQITASEGLAPSQALDLIQNIVADLSDGNADNVGRNGGALPNNITATPSHIINGLEGASNDFLRSSRNASGIKGASSPKYTPAQPSSPPVAPGTAWGAPTNVAATAADASVTVSWSAVAGATSYNVYYSAVSGTGASGTYVSGSASPVTVTGLNNNVIYYFVVTAVNSTAESSASSEVSATPAVATAWGAPTGVIASAGDASVTVSWSAVTGATSYNVYYSAVSGTGAGGTHVSGAASPVTVTLLSNNVIYYFVVTAVSLTAESTASSEVFATPTAACNVTLTDGNLTSCVSSAMTAYGVTCATSLTNLECPNNSISSLSGIETLTGLTLLNLSGNSIVDVTPITSLINLEQLDLANNLITTGVGTLATSLVNLWSIVINCNTQDVIDGTCTDTNGTGIPCSELQSLIDAVSSHGGMGGIAQPISVLSGNNCT